MVSRRNGELKRSVFSALAAMVAVALPSLVAFPAQAETPSGSTGSRDAAREEQGKAGKHEKHEAKPASKTAHAVKGQKPHAKQDAAQKQEASKKTEEAQANAKAKHDAVSAASPNGKKVKKTASRAAKGSTKKSAKKADAEAPRRPCYGPSVTMDRGGLEGESFSLLDCHGAPLDAARAELSLLARPWSVARPRPRAAPIVNVKGKPGRAPAPGEVAPGVRLVDPGLLKRLDAVTRKFPNRPISLVSGYRPQSRGSQHQSAKALDLRVAGVSNEELVAFCKTLADTGCGYYPNSSFVHIDVRNPGTGGVSWIDASGPEEAPRYVKQWPPPPEEANTRQADSDHAEPHDGASDPWQRDPDPDPSAADDEPGAEDPTDGDKPSARSKHGPL